MSLVINTNTWISLADAETYMLTRMGASKIWTEDLTIGDKEAALVTAYNQLSGCGKWIIPAVISTVLKIAQCEMALFLLKNQEDIDARAGIQAQGVVKAGIVQEEYSLDAKDELPMPSLVKQLLSEYENSSACEIIGLERDEDEDVS